MSAQWLCHNLHLCPFVPKRTQRLQSLLLKYRINEQDKNRYRDFKDETTF